MLRGPLTLGVTLPGRASAHPAIPKRSFLETLGVSMARTRRTVTRPVSARTAARRARRLQAAATAKQTAERRADRPETLGQARVWQRKNGRYLIAGLCTVDAATAAWGHAEGFQHLPPPCSRCQPLVDKFPNAGPRGSKWRKILDKLEYMNEETLGAWLTAYEPDDYVADRCDHAWCESTGYAWEKVPA